MGNVSLNLEKMLDARGMSLQELGGRMGFDEEKLSRIENGDISSVRLSTLAEMCDTLKCEPGDLLRYSTH